MVRVRPFVRVAGNLSLSVTELSANVPPFNPQKMLAESGARKRPTAEAPPPSPTPRFLRHPRPRLVLPRAKIAVAAPIDEVIARVREAANWTGPPQQLRGAGGNGGGIKLAYAARARRSLCRL